MKRLVGLCLVMACAQPVAACDVCSIYAAAEAQGGSGKGFLGGVAEQYTYFNTLQMDGRDVPNGGTSTSRARCRRCSSVTISMTGSGCNLTCR